MNNYITSRIEGYQFLGHCRECFLSFAMKAAGGRRRTDSRNGGSSVELEVGNRHDCEIWIINLLDKASKKEQLSFDVVNKS